MQAFVAGVRRQDMSERDGNRRLAAMTTNNEG
jgi:hypothetical protein